MDIYARMYIYLIVSVGQLNKHNADKVLFH